MTINQTINTGVWVAKTPHRRNHENISKYPMKAARRLTCLLLLAGQITFLQQSGNAKEKNIIEQIESIIYTDNKGYTHSIEPGSLGLTIVTPKLLHSQLIKPFKSQQDLKATIEICQKEFDVFTCQSIYGSPKENLPDRPPTSLLALDISWAYIQITYSTIKERRSRRIGKVIKTKINCLNPAMPIGYWTVASKSTDIVQISDLRMINKKSANNLELELCSLIKRKSDSIMVYKN